MTDLSPFVDQLKERLPIEEVVGRKVRLARSAGQYKGLCPFHAEKTPSFSVHPGRNSYKCFGCGKGGDIITFVRETEGLSFLEALAILADQAGVQMPQTFSRGERQAPEERQQVREVLQLARRWMQEQLRGPEAASARSYLKDRCIPEEAWNTFGLGWAPRDRQAFLRECERHKLPLAAAEKAGLLLEDKERGQSKARFWERLMFPVADSGGRTVGFGGRYLPGSFAEEKQLGKYVNSPEGPLFPKRKLLYGVEHLQAALREQPDAPLILCEGYLDVIMLHQAGFRTAVAALGTALTEDHARLLRRYDRPVILMLDPDEAGRRAAARGGRLLVAEGLDTRIARLPDGADPADMVAAGREEELSRVVSDSWDILRWRLETWVRKEDLSLPAVTHRAASEMAEWIASTPSPVVAERWLAEAATTLGISQDALRSLLRPDRPRAGAVGGEAPAAPRSHSSGPEEVLTRNEREIVSILLHDPSTWSSSRTVLEGLELQDSLADKLFQWCRSRREEGVGFDLEEALTAFASDPQLGAWLDNQRHHRFEDPRQSLSRALEALPGNRDQVHAAGGTSLDDLAAFSRPIRITPQD